MYSIRHFLMTLDVIRLHAHRIKSTHYHQILKPTVQEGKDKFTVIIQKYEGSSCLIEVREDKN
jgi:C4-type Zn-finger protein